MLSGCAHGADSLPSVLRKESCMQSFRSFAFGLGLLGLVASAGLARAETAPAPLPRPTTTLPDAPIEITLPKAADVVIQKVDLGDDRVVCSLATSNVLFTMAWVCTAVTPELAPAPKDPAVPTPKQ